MDIANGIPWVETPDAENKRPAATMEVNGRPASTVAEVRLTTERGKSRTCTRSRNELALVEGKDGDASAIRLQEKHQADGDVGAEETQAQPEIKRGASQPMAGNDSAASAKPNSNNRRRRRRSTIAKPVVTRTGARIEDQHSGGPMVSLTPDPSSDTDGESSSGTRFTQTSPGRHSSSCETSSDTDQPQAARSEPSQPVAQPVVDRAIFSSPSGCTFIGRAFYAEDLSRYGEWTALGMAAKFFEYHKNGEFTTMADGNEQWRLFKDFNKRDANRGMTRNWSKWEIMPDGRLQDKAQTQLLRDTIKMKIRIHSGEVRTWPSAQTEMWCAAESRIREALLRTRSGQTSTGRTSAARKGDCEIHDKLADIAGSQWRPPTDIFSSMYACHGCSPDLENAISTLAVRDCDGKGVCVREVSCITLGELFAKYGETRTYAELYAEWMKGCIVIKRRTL